MREYLALPALSSGVAHTLLSESPMHARMAQQSERAGSSEADIGTYAHAMLLEGGHTALEVIDAEDWRTKAAKEARDIARATGKLPILQKKVAEVEQMVKAAREFIAGSAVSSVFNSGAAERTIVWQEGDIWLKARPDWLSDDFLLHFKTTTASVNPRAFSRIVAGSGYDLAMLFYVRGLNAVLPDNQVNHLILAQEQFAPYACKLFDLSSAKADIAERRVERAIQTWGECLATNVWPSYDGQIHTIDVQGWELAQAEEELAGDLTDDELSGGIPA
jgi:hypothetical protein